MGRQRLEDIAVHALVKITVAVTKHNGQKKIRRERCVWLILPLHTPSLTEVKAGTQAGQESGGRS